MIIIIIIIMKILGRPFGRVIEDFLFSEVIGYAKYGRSMIVTYVWEYRGWA